MIGGKLHSIYIAGSIKKRAPALPTQARGAHFYSCNTAVGLCCNKPCYNTINGKRRRIWVAGVCPFYIISFGVMSKIIKLRERKPNPA